MGKTILAKSQRIVVDELFDNGTARILRSSHLAGNAEDGRAKDDRASEDYSIKAWGDEAESFIDIWRMEAFMGFSAGQRLREGDVFYVVDGTRLDDAYRPIPREEAREKHLLVPWKESTRFARQEIKKEFYKLSVTRMTKQTNEQNYLMKRVDQKFEDKLPGSGSDTGSGIGSGQGGDA